MNDNTSPSGFRNLCCRLCGHTGPDLRLAGCSCVLHAKCTPLSVVISNVDPQYGGIPPPVTSKATQCPICHGVVTGIQLFPMSFTDLDRAIELRKQCAQAAIKASQSGKDGGKDPRKRGRDNDDDEAIFHQIQAEASNLLLSHTRTGAGATDSQNHRTGRWSSEEVAFVDNLVTAFDHGYLSLPHGVKLNEFLGDILLCKSSRLTKKMKNAKLSSRSFTLAPCDSMKTFCPSTLSALEEQFLNSIPSEAMQLELRFNMTKLWRIHFSNLCLQVGYEMLDARDWVASLEEMERRASQAEEVIRRARRRRMGLALRQDVGASAKPGVFIGGRPARETAIQPSHILSSNMSGADFSSFALLDGDAPQRPSTTTVSDESTKDDEDAEFLANVMEISNGIGVGRPRSMSDDYSIAIEDLMDPLSQVNEPPQSYGDCGPFLERVVRYLESENLPFEHADIWVPSFLGRDRGKPSKAQLGTNLRLFHAGHATRSDLGFSMTLKMNEFGAYSTNFSFAPGVGLPGRVYASGRPSWEGGVHNADPTFFERAGGAKVYSVRCALGIPLNAPNIGRIVLAIYSTNELPNDKEMTARFVAYCSKWIPEPKWKLVIDLGPNDQSLAFGSSDQPGPPGADPTLCLPGTTGQLQNIHENLRESNPDCSQRTGSQIFQTRANSNVEPPEAPKVLPTSVEESGMHGDEEDMIAGLLGDHMPIAGTATTNSDVLVLLPHFMSLRLLLLRSPARRSGEETEVLETIKKSFKGYSKDNRRVGAELATLLVKDWMYLSQNLQPAFKTTPSQQHGQHRCHVMQAPTVQTSSSTGAPTVMPSTLVSMNMAAPSQVLSQHQLPHFSINALGDSTKLVHRCHSFPDKGADDNLSSEMKRAVSEMIEEQSAHQANIVPES